MPPLTAEELAMIPSTEEMAATYLTEQDLTFESMPVGSGKDSRHQSGISADESPRPH